VKLVIQRVKRASIVSGGYYASIGRGLLVFVGVGKDDESPDSEFAAEKTANLRVFPDRGGRLNYSVREICGGILAVPQFTLYGDCRKGRRPSFDASADKEKGSKYFNMYVEKLKEHVDKVESGLFGADMEVELINSGPVTLIIDTRQ